MITTCRLIVVGSDNSSRAQSAVDYAADLAQSLGATLRIVTAHRAFPSAHSLAPYVLCPPPRERHESDAVDAHLSFLRPVAQRLRRRGLAVELHVVTGDPASVVVDDADDVGADLIVIGDRGLHGLRAWFSSAARSVIRHATVPVLVVPTG